MSRSFRCEDSLSPVLPSEVRIAVLSSLWQGQHRREALWRWVMMGPTGNWASSNAAFTTSCRSCGSAIVRPFFASRFSAMLLSPKLSHQVRQLTYRISSESYPGNQECVVNYYGAERLYTDIEQPLT